MECTNIFHIFHNGRDPNDLSLTFYKHITVPYTHSKFNSTKLSITNEGLVAVDCDGNTLQMKHRNTEIWINMILFSVKFPSSIDGRWLNCWNSNFDFGRSNDLVQNFQLTLELWKAGRVVHGHCWWRFQPVFRVRFEKSAFFQSTSGLIRVKSIRISCRWLHTPWSIADSDDERIANRLAQVFFQFTFN